jgi:subtilase family serine protease
MDIYVAKKKLTTSPFYFSIFQISIYYMMSGGESDFPFSMMRTVTRFNNSANNMKYDLNKKNVFISAISIFILVSSLAIPNALAYSCSTTSSKWTDSSLCGHGTMVAIIVTSHDPMLENKLAAYNAQFGLPACTLQNGCLEIPTPYGISNSNPSSNSDISHFVEQAHQAAPGAKILVVEAKSISWDDKMDAVNYVKMLPEVAKVSSASYSKVVMILGLALK